MGLPSRADEISIGAGDVSPTRNRMVAMAKHNVRFCAAFTVPAKFNRNFTQSLVGRFVRQPTFGQNGEAILGGLQTPKYSQGGNFDYENNEENSLIAARSIDDRIVLCYDRF